MDYSSLLIKLDNALLGLIDRETEISKAAAAGKHVARTHVMRALWLEALTARMVARGETPPSAEIVHAVEASGRRGAGGRKGKVESADVNEGKEATE